MKLARILLNVALLPIPAECIQELESPDSLTVACLVLQVEEDALEAQRDAFRLRDRVDGPTNLADREQRLQQRVHVTGGPFIHQPDELRTLLGLVYLLKGFVALVFAIACL